MLSTYFNALPAHGFVIERVVEPEPGRDWLDRNPGKAPVPVYLIACCRNH
jgi:hypothetical protein